tara:strand:+ start:229 stop:435 length:207 start_codon:yes stop_codon:yes gene_type:complete
MHKVFRLLSLGFVVAIPLIGGIGLGIFVDSKLEIEDPIFTLGGILLGTIVAGWAVYLLIKPLISAKHK